MTPQLRDAELHLLPTDLQSDQQLQLSAEDYPVSQTNPVTGYRTALYRNGAIQPDDFLGWIVLTNAEEAVGYIYLRKPGGKPYLGSSRYVVMDVSPKLLDSLLQILQSREPLQIRFYQGTADGDASAFLEHRS